MNALALPAAGRAAASVDASLRRSPSLLAAVIALHGLLVALLLQPRIAVTMLEHEGAPRGVGAGERLQVQLIEPATEPPPSFPPPPISVWAPVPVSLPEATMPDLETSAEESLTGVYLAQVRARIERAWEAQRNVSVPALPDCLVRITLGDHGAVLGVAFAACEINARDRDALMRAVRAAAPLPAPPAALPAKASLEFWIARAPHVNAAHSAQ